MIALIAIMGLAVNIKTIALNDKIRKITQNIATLKEENEGLWLSLLTHNALENIDRIATSQLGMGPGKGIVFLPTESHAAK